MPFQLESNYKPRGDQGQAIAKLLKSVEAGNRHQTLLGVTGSGKTFTIANVIRDLDRPTLVISHNKTLAAQLYSEFKQFFPRNAVEIYPATADEEAVRVDFFGDEIDAITRFDPLTGHAHESLSVITFYPAKQFVTPADKLNRALRSIREELEARIVELEAQGKLLEAQRLKMRTEYDLEMLQEMGFCNGIENYSRHLSGRPLGPKPYTIIDFFPKDFLVVDDESPATIPQIGGMYEGDRSRKTVLVNYGFRLPSALDNRPLNFPEFM